MFVGFENLRKVGQTHRLQMFPREIRLRLHDLSRGARRICKHAGKGFLFAILGQQVGDKIDAIAIRKCESFFEIQRRIVKLDRVGCAHQHALFQSFDNLR